MWMEGTSNVTTVIHLVGVYTDTTCDKNGMKHADSHGENRLTYVQY